MNARVRMRVLILEDNEDDAALMVAALAQARFDTVWTRVDTREQFASALGEAFDLILADYSLAQFTGLDALALVRSRDLDVPFILISGSIGEDIAVAALHSGADDYLLKDRMARLGPAVMRAMEKRRLRAQTANAELALRESEERFRQITENIREVFWLADLADGAMLYVSPGYELVWGRSRDALLASPGARIDAVHPEDRSRVQEAVSGLRSAGAYDLQYRIVRPDGSVRSIHDKAFPVRNAAGAVYRVAGVAEDVTEDVARQRRIERLSRVRAVSGAINAAIVRIRDREALLEETCRIADRHGRFDMVWIGEIDCDRQVVRAAAWSGFSATAAHAVSWESIAAARGTISDAIRTRSAAVKNDIGAALAGGGLREEAMRAGCFSTVCLPVVVDDAVQALIVLFAAGRDFFDDEELALLNEVAADVSFALQSIASRERVEYLSYYDPLTGLPNRTLFIDRAGNMRARSGDRPAVALLLLNIERFRHINDTFGRHGGDELLRLAAKRLAAALGGNESLARIGADNFGILIRGIADPGTLVHAIETRVLGCFAQPFMIGGAELRVAAKLGVALHPADGEHAETLLNNAEAALKNARVGGERFLFYAAHMNAEAAQVVSLETRLRKAVEENQFVLHYQPKIEMASGIVRGLEALIRWQDPASGQLIAPGRFIPLLEETGMIFEVGKWAIGQALNDHRAWRARGRAPERVAVNVSAVQLRRRDFVDTVAAMINQGVEDAEALELEVTESLLMHDVQANMRMLLVLRGMGVRIAIDDFGTGYSSLSYITRLPISSIKIDRSFVNEMGTSVEAKAIVSTIITLAHALGLRTVAEGVETEEQAEVLRSLDCDEAQGYLFARPMPAQQLVEFLAARNT